MNNFVILFVIALCGTSSALNVDRIIGGTPSNDNDLRYMVSLQQLSQITAYTRGHRCGGALVTLRHAVTTASCLYNNLNGVHTLIAPNEYRVFAGATVLTNDASADRHRTIERFTVHPNFNAGTPYVNDIAVITLTSAFPSSAVATVSVSNNDATPAQGYTCTSSGWGAQNNTNSPSTQLMHVQKSVTEQVLCRAYYNGLGSITLAIQDSMICAWAGVPSSSCSGDYGNPLVCNGNLNGILIVQGHDCSSTIALSPEVYTRVSSFASWINTTAGASTFQPGMAVLAVIAIVQIISAKVLN